MSIFMSLSRFYLHLSISLTAACGSTYEETVLGVKGEPEGKVSRSMPLSLCLSLCLYLVSSASIHQLNCSLRQHLRGNSARG